MNPPNYAQCQEAICVATEIREALAPFVEKIKAIHPALYASAFEGLVAECIETCDVIVSRVSTYGESFNGVEEPEQSEDEITYGEFIHNLVEVIESRMADLGPGESCVLRVVKSEVPLDDTGAETTVH